MTRLKYLFTENKNTIRVCLIRAIKYTGKNLTI